jgi:hypothetical protein
MNEPPMPIVNDPVDDVGDWIMEANSVGEVINDAASMD